MDGTSRLPEFNCRISLTLYHGQTPVATPGTRGIPGLMYQTHQGTEMIKVLMVLGGFFWQRDMGQPDRSL